MTGKHGPNIGLLEFISFISVLAVGVAVALNESIALDIAERSAWIRRLFSFQEGSMLIGVFSGMFIVGAVVRALILILMQHLIAKNAERADGSARAVAYVVLGRLAQLGVVCLIFIFIFRSSTYQHSMSSGLLFVLPTALLIHLLFAAVGDSLKQILFLAWRSYR